MHTKHICEFCMSGAPTNEIKDEPQSGVGCEADAFMNWGLNCSTKSTQNSLRLQINHAIVIKEGKELEEGIMVSQKVVIKNPTGLHLRPAGILCKEAMQFKSLITFTFRDSTANAKSVLSVLGACVKSGDEIEFVCEGEDEEEALKTLVAAVESGLGE